MDVQSARILGLQARFNQWWSPIAIRIQAVSMSPTPGQKSVEVSVENFPLEFISLVISRGFNVHRIYSPDGYRIYW